MTIQITARVIKEELERRGVPVEAISSSGGTILSFEHSGRRRFTRSSSIDSNSSIASTICDDKAVFAQTAKYADLVTPETLVYENHGDAQRFMNDHGKIVVKPARGAHGNAVTVNVDDNKKLDAALAAVRKAYPESKTILQRQVKGDDYRLLIIGAKLAAASRRTPANVTGDGRSTLKELILKENSSPDRTVEYSEKLCKIDESEAWIYLGERASTVPGKDEVVQVVGTANIGSGGQADDVTDIVPESVVDTAVRLCDLIGASVCGVDFMHDADTDEWWLIEANLSPSFGLHLNPHSGVSRSVDAMFVDEMLSS